MTAPLHVVLVPTTEMVTGINGTSPKTLYAIEVNGQREPKTYGSYLKALDRVLTIQAWGEAEIDFYNRQHAPLPETEAEAADWLEAHDLAKLRAAERAIR